MSSSRPNRNVTRPPWGVESPAFLPVVILALLLLSGCAMPFGPTPEPTLPPATLPAFPTPTPEIAGEQPALPPGPAILVQQEIGAGTLLLIRYDGAGQACLAATFTAEVFQVNRCGEALAPGAPGVGFVDTLTDPAGAAVRAAYGVVHDPAITAVAVEFAGGGNANAAVQNGGYVLALDSNQVPRRALGINQYGNLVGEWRFE